MKKTVLIAATVNGLPEHLEALVQACKEYGLEATYVPWELAAEPGRARRMSDEVLRRACLVFFVWTKRCGGALPDTGESLAQYQLRRAAEMAVEVAYFWPKKLTIRHLKKDEAEDELWDRVTLEIKERLSEDDLKKKYQLNKCDRPDGLRRLANATIFHTLYPEVAENLKVLISSTVEDLRQEREELKSHLLNLGVDVKMQEHLLQAVPDPERTSLHLVQDSNFYLGIVANRYGSVVPRKGMSYTHLEYDHAKRLNRPVAVMLATEQFQADVTLEDEPRESRLLLKKFRQQLEGEQFRVEFSDGEELTAKAIGMIQRLRAPNATRMPFTSRIPSPPAPYYAHPYGLLDTEELVGRERELRELDDWVGTISSPLRSARVLVVEARGGTGKSALTWTWVKSNKERFKEGVIWWSFYHHNSTFGEFIDHALAYLDDELPPTDDPARDRIAQVHEHYPHYERRQERLLDLLYRKRVLIVLDGLERRLTLYNYMRALNYEHKDLDELVADLVAQYKGRFKGGADSPEIDLEARKYFRRMEPAEAQVLRRLVNPEHDLMCRILVTSRFFPSDLEEEYSERELPRCRRLPLAPFDETQTKRLWAAYGLTWEPGAWRLIEKCGGYPIYTCLLAQSVRRDQDGPGPFTKWDEADRNATRPEEARSLVVLSGIEGINGFERRVLYHIANNPLPTSFDELVDAFVGEDEECLDAEDLYRVLCDLRRRKLAGLEAQSASYDLHPIVRDGLRLSLSGDLEEYAKRSVKRIDWRRKHQEWQKRYRSLDELIARFVSVLETARVARAPDAPDLFLLCLYDLLRFRSYRFEYLHYTLEALAREADPDATPDVRASLHVRLSDSLILQGRVSEALAAAERALALSGAPATLAEAMLDQGRGLIHQTKLWGAERVLRQGLSTLARAGVYDGSVCRWLWAILGRVAVSRGDYELAGRALREAQRIGGTDDADALALELQLALATQPYRALEVADRRLAVSEDEQLGLGRISSYLGLAEAHLEGGSLDDARGYAYRGFDLAVTTGLLAYAPRAALLLGRVCRVKGMLPEARKYLDFALQEAEQLDHRAAALLEQARLLRAEGAAEDEVRAAAVEAGRLLWGEGGAYSFAKELAEVRALLGEEAEALLWAGAPAPPDEPMEELPKRVIDRSRLPQAAYFGRQRGSLSDTTGWSAEQVLGRLEAVKQQLDWGNTDGSAQRWWQAFEEENRHRQPLVLRLAEELEARASTIKEFFSSYLLSDTENILANLYFQDYSKIRKSIEEEQREGAEALRARGATPRAEELSGWAQKVVAYHAAQTRRTADDMRGDASLAWELRQACGWEEGGANVIAWWDDYEKRYLAHTPDLTLASLLEMTAGQITLAEFQHAFVNARTDDCEALIYYIEYDRLKEQEARRKKELAGSDAAAYAPKVENASPDDAPEQLGELLEELKSKAATRRRDGVWNRIRSLLRP